MRLIEFNKVDKKRISLVESARIQHAEDLIFWEGSRGALAAIQQLEKLSKNTQALTIKWDGSPAVVFGRNPNGEFIFTDKAGFIAKGYDGKATNPEDLEAIIMQRAKDDVKKKSYQQYANKMKNVFDAFQKAVPSKFQGYFVGDMLYFQTPNKQGDSFVFKPNVVQYAVKVNSELGQKISKSQAGVVVHNLMDESGKILPIQNLNMIQGSDVLVIPPTTVNKKQPINVTGLQQIKSIVNSNAKQMDALLDKNKLAQLKLIDFPNILYTYTNAKVDSGLTNLGHDFTKWLMASAVSEPKKKRIVDYIKQNINGFSAVWKAVSGIMTVKDNIVQQLDSAEGDVTATINGKPGGEGYVLKSPQGNIKLVQRSGFTKANRAINR